MGTTNDAWTRPRGPWRAIAAGAVLALSLSSCAFISRASVSTSGEPAESDTPISSPPTISADGRYIAFDSYAGNLVPTAPDGGIFVRDTRANTTQAVSVRMDGTVDDWADSPAISGDGRFVAFVSSDAGLVPGGNDNFYQVFLRDRLAGFTTRVSSKVNGNQGTGDSDAPSLSHDGRYIAFESDSPGLVVGDTNESTDVFVRDRVSGTTRRVSVDAFGTELENGGDDPSIDASGTLVAFKTSEVLLPADTNHFDDVYVRNLVTNALTLVSTGPGGVAANSSSWKPVLSANGQSVAFVSAATNLDATADGNGQTDVFVRDLAGATTRVSRSATGAFAHGASAAPSLSGDGRFVSFESNAADVVDGDANGQPDAFVVDRATGVATRISTDQLGQELAPGGADAVLSADGRSVTFHSAGAITGLTETVAPQLYVRLTVPGTSPR